MGPSRLGLPREREPFGGGATFAVSTGSLPPEPTGLMPLTQLPLLVALAMAPLQFLPEVPDTTVIPGRRAPAPTRCWRPPASALGRGRPWQASRLITPVVEDSSQRTPPAVFLAATAASRWGGWPEVGRLLQGEAWLDSLFEGRGRVLLARSALERGADSARPGARARRPQGARPRVGGRAALPARLRARPGGRARTAPPRATSAPRRSCRWCRTGSSSAPPPSPTTARAGPGSTSGSTGPIPRERIRWTEAAAHQRTGDLDGAARRYRRARRAAHRRPAPARR